jgi:hypothetical protein
MSIFDSNANTSFNSFGPPTNIWGDQNQGWGINPAYLTPAYTAPYRPPYMGGQTHNPNPGFFQAAYGASPFNFRGPPYGVNTSGYETSNWDSLYNKTSDFGASAIQRVGFPLVAFTGAMALGKHWQKPIGAGLAFGNDASPFTVKGWNSMWGKPPGATISGFAGMGARFGGGAAQSMLGGIFGQGIFSGAGMGGSLARGAVGLAGGVGAAVGGIGIPLALAQGAISTFDNFVSDNYIGVRENTNALRQGFSGVTFGSGMGDRFTGAGLSRSSAARMGTSLTQFGAKDQVFDAREMASMTSMSAQMGLLDNTPGEQLTSKMKAIVNQVKAVMSVAGTTEFKEVLQIMAKLQMAGVNSTHLSSTFSGLGSYASQAGVSVNRLVNTVGAQGQYLFQANGLTPYVGQITAANAMAGFASAFRSGLISNDLMARMGGVEGATQSSLTGQLNAAQTTYNMMRGFNRYTSGTGGQGVIQNIANFGNTFAGNPFEAYGAMLLSGRKNISQMLKDEGPMAIYNQAREIADINPLIGKGVAFNQRTLAAQLSGMGMDEQQITAYMSELGSYQDPKTMALRSAAMRSNRIQMQKDYLSQTEQTFGMTLPGVQSLMSGLRTVRSGIAGAIGGVYGGSGSMMDAIAARVQGVNYGSSTALAGGTAAELADLSIPSLEDRAERGSRKNINYNAMLGQHRSDMQKVVRAAQDGDSTARKALRGDREAVMDLAARGVIDARYGGGNDSAQLAELMTSAPRAGGGTALEDTASRLSKNMRNGIFGVNTSEGEMLKGYRLAYKMQEVYDKGGELSPEMLAEAKGRFGDYSSRELKQRAQRAIGEAVDFGVDMSKDYQSQNSGEAFVDYAKRTNMRFDASVTHRSDNASLADKVKEARSRVQVNRQEQQMNQTRDTLMGMGRIDLVAAYDMTGAAKDLKDAATMQKEAAQLVITKLGKEVTPQAGGKPSFSNPTPGSLLDKTYKIMGY